MVRKLRKWLMMWSISLVVYLVGEYDWGLSGEELGQFAMLTIKILKPLASDRGRVDLEEMEALFAGLGSAG